MFKIKDLMIKIIPEEGKMAAEQPVGCGDFMTCGGCTNCTGDCTACTNTRQCLGGCSDLYTCKGGSRAMAGCGLTCAPNTCRVCTVVCTDECSACSQQVLTCKCTDSPTCRVGTCGYGSCQRTYGVAEAQQQLTLENLAVLKAQLRQQLAAVEEQEKLAHESLRPASLAEAEALEKKLIEALDEIKTIKPA